MGAKEMPGPTPGRAEGDPDVTPSREEKRERDTEQKQKPGGR
jgi:hypothetical protein